MVDISTPKKPKDIIHCSYNRKTVQIGECPTCGYCVSTAVDEDECLCCGQKLNWYKLGVFKK